MAEPQRIKTLTLEEVRVQVEEWEEIARNYENVPGSLARNLKEACAVIRAFLRDQPAEASQRAEVSQPVGTKAKMIGFCGRCGTPLYDDGGKFCTSCGLKLER